MSIELYFLRSSENKIVTDMIKYAYRLDEVEKSLKDMPQLKIYSDFYGLTRKDLGLYALVNNKIAAAIWSREFNNKPTISMAVLPTFRGVGLGSQILTQFLLEAGELYEEIYVDVAKNSKAVKFYKKFGFYQHDDREKKSLVNGLEVITMIKKLKLKKVLRPTDNYDASYWMD